MLRISLFLLLICGLEHHCKCQDKKLIRSIYFGGGSYYIDDIQKQGLVNFLDSIPNIRDYTITIHSHTDNIGGAAFNKRLSELRSWSAKQLLISNYAKDEDVEIQDFGQLNPLYDNNTQFGRYKNRRVDIIFWPISF
ncbi:MAG: OmpA family protein [Cyclobacteriaceae bacterium]|jgi:outer membrane protein OmpA-like peptidoglycan-associated protein|nr:OmpA family protein [Cyclobacteriaceae bacterium]